MLDRRRRQPGCGPTKRRAVARSGAATAQDQASRAATVPGSSHRWRVLCGAPGSPCYNAGVRIRSCLLLLTAVVLVPGLLAAAVAVAKVREGERQAALRGLRETVRATSLLVDGEVQRSLGTLLALGQSNYLQTGDFAALYGQASAADQKPDVWTLVLDASGQQRLNTSVPYGTPLPPAVAQDRVAKVLQTMRPLVSDLLVSPFSGKLLTTIYAPAKVSPAGSFVLAQAFSVEHWNKTARQPGAPSRWIVAVIDRQGRFIWRSHGTDAFVGKNARPELVAAAAAAPQGLIRHATLEGIDSYDAFTHSALTGWTIAVAAPVPTIEASATQAVLWLTAGLAMALVVALLGATLLGRVLLTAIDSASAAARALGRGEPPTTAATPVFEINVLNHALEDAAHLLQQEQETRKRVELQRAQLLENERLARAAAEQENLAKDKFLALLGHELRNPLAAMSGASEVLARSRADAAVQDRFIGVIQRQNRHMRRIVDDLLDVSRMLSGKIELSLQPLDLADCVRRCVESLQAGDAGSAQQWRLQTTSVWVQGDPVRLEQIINNLASNARHFSPPDTAITIRVYADGGHAVLEVSDLGPGVPAALLPRIFEAFVQGPPPAGRQSRGLGIGLSLVKQLVELHGGSVVAWPGADGVGSRFCVRLPRIDAPQLAAGATAAPPQRLAGHHILLVDDNPDARRPTAALLRAMGHQVAEAADGGAAVALAMRQLPAIILVDLALPGKSGYLVAAELKAIPALRDVPLIALGGLSQPDDQAASSAAGFVAHLVQPLTADALGQAIAARLGA